MNLYPSGGLNGPARHGLTVSSSGSLSSGTAPGGMSNAIPYSSQEITAPSEVTFVTHGDPRKFIPGNSESLIVTTGVDLGCSEVGELAKPNKMQS